MACHIQARCPFASIMPKIARRAAQAPVQYHSSHIGIAIHYRAIQVVIWVPIPIGRYLDLMRSIAYKFVVLHHHIAYIPYFKKR